MNATQLSFLDSSRNLATAIALGVALIASGCAGPNGKSGTDGLSVALEANELAEATGCPGSGVELKAGRDIDGDGVLDAGEVNATWTTTVCDGVSPASSEVASALAANETFASGVAGQLTTDPSVTDAVAGAVACAQFAQTTCKVHLWDTDASACAPTDTAVGDETPCTTRFGGGTCASGRCVWSGNGSLGTYGLSVAFQNGRLEFLCNGTMCTQSNAAYVVLPGRVSGNLTLRLDTPVFFYDATGTSPDLVDQPFGTTAGVAWDSDRPMFIYAVNGDDTAAGLRFAVSPQPNAAHAPVGGNLGFKGTPSTSDNQSVFFVMTGDDPAVSYANAPVLPIGSLRMTKNASDYWKVALPLDPSEGIGRFDFGGRDFHFPTGQRGAASGSYFAEREGGTAPTYETQKYSYVIGRDGTVHVFITLQGAGMGGAGDEFAVVALPYRARVAEGSVSGSMVGDLLYQADAYNTRFHADFGSGLDYFYVEVSIVGQAGVPLRQTKKLGDFPTGMQRAMYLRDSYMAF